MSLDSRLEAWVEADLLDAATAERIRAHEARRERPVLRLALVGLGLLAVLLGIALLISANWDRIAPAAKLSAHMALLAGAAAAHWWASGRGRTQVAEAALFLFTGLVLAGIALQAQVYQLTGPLWHALLTWLLIAGPALLLAGRTRLTGLQFAALALVGPAAMAADTVDDGGLWRLAQGAAMAVPALLLALSFLPRAHAPGFRLALREAGMVAMLAGASIAHFAWDSDISAPEAIDNAVRLAPVAAAAALALWLGRRPGSDLPRPLLLPLIALPPVAFALALAIPHPDTMLSRFIGVLVFVGMWGAVARAAALVGWNSLFAVAIAAIGLRIFIIYFELFGSLAATGGGLVVGGLLLVALSWVWHRFVTRRKAP